MTDYNDLITRLRSMDGKTPMAAADAIAELVDRVAYLESRLEISPEHDIDGIAARDATIHHQDECISELKFRLAEAEDTNKALRVRLGSELHEPVTTVEDRYNADGKSCHITDDLPAGMPLYAAPPVAAPVRLTDSQINDASGDGILDCLCDPYDKDESGDSYSSIPHDLRRFARAIESAVIRANGFKVEGEQ